MIGAGIVGVATAIWLRRRGHAVVLLDRAGPAAGASRGNAGRLAASGIVPVTVPGLWRQVPRMLGGPLFLRPGYLPRLAPFMARYLRGCTAPAVERVAGALRPLVGDSLAEHQALAAGTGAERFVVPCDYAYLYRDRAAREADGFAWSVRRRHGFVGREEDGAAFRAAEPGFAAGGWAVRLGGHGRIADPGAYVEALAAAAVRDGVVLRLGTAEGVVVGGGRVRGLRVDGAEMPAGALVVAAGAWSARLLAPLGVRVPLETERGYHLDLWEPDWMPSIPVMLSWGKAVVAPMAGRLRIAGLVEYGGLEAAASEGPVRYLRQLVAEALPGLRWSRQEAWMGHRPVLADSLPAIGPVPGVRGLWAAFGHGHLGLTGGPATGRILAGLLAGERSNLDLAPYEPARFAGAGRNQG